MKDCRKGTAPEMALVEAVAEAVMLMLRGPQGLRKHKERRAIAKAEHAAKFKAVK